LYNINGNENLSIYDTKGRQKNMFMCHKKRLTFLKKSYKNRLTHIIHPSHREKLTVAQPIEAFPTFYDTLMFIEPFT
jgi:hypothetical protein